jgi:hypothetical protein
MSKSESECNDIERALSMLSPEQIATLMGKLTIHKKQRFHRIDYSFRERSLKTTNLYFSCEPKPHMFDNFETYVGHADGIREQVISGVEI